MNDSFFCVSLILGYRTISAPGFFIKSSVNNTPINRYHAQRRFGEASLPVAVATPEMR